MPSTRPRAWRLSGPWALLTLVALGWGPAVSAWEWSGYLAFEGRGFYSEEGLDGQDEGALSIAFEPELYHDWDDGDQLFVVSPFVRFDSDDDERSHFDIRELYWQRVGRSWELSVGWRKVFWGVTESDHLVDVINQTDLVEDLDGEQKLGQAMVQLSLIRRWGTFELFMLPGFRERTFPGVDGRLRTDRRVDVDNPRYESSAEDGHVDWALRWAHSVGAWDLGASYFYGTGRAPELQPDTVDGEEVLVPFYEQLQQAGLDIQGTFGAWLLKLEAIAVWDNHEAFRRALGGFEYTFFDVGERGLDVGALLELSSDSRNGRPETVFVATRVSLNDVQSTEILAGIVASESQGELLNIEASRRLGDRWRLGLRARAFLYVEPEDPLGDFRDDSYLELELTRFF